jgi:3-oxoacyl-(acyl-carrier-protein) synthase
VSRPIRAPRRVVVTGTGVVSALGDNLDGFCRALLDGRSAIGPVGLFDTAPFACRVAGEVAGFAPERYLAEGNFRPLDRAGQLATAAAKLALADAGWRGEGVEPAELGLVLGTMFGSLRTIAEFDRRAQTAGVIYAKPMDFANSVINAAAGQAAIWHRLEGINATISGGPAAGLAALAYAAELIRTGRARYLLAGGADELAFEAFAGFERAGELVAGEATPRPFDAVRGGCALGEGAAFLMLEEAESAAARGAHVLAEVRGWSSCFDPSRGRDEAAATAAGARSVREALAEAELAPEALDCVFAAARGSVRADRHEALGLVAGLGEAAAQVPVTALAGALGECLGASGAFSALGFLATRASGRLPGTHGFTAQEAGAPALALAATARPVAAEHGFLHAAGFDGNHVGVVLSAPR